MSPLTNHRTLLAAACSSLLALLATSACHEPQPAPGSDPASTAASADDREDLAEVSSRDTKSCTKDADCQPTQWCSTPATTTPGVCVPKVPNSQPVPAGPPINGQCTPENGQRTCLSAVCEESDDLCGKKNSSPCPGGPDQCRSTRRTSAASRIS